MTRVVNRSPRRGAVLPLTAILLVVLLAMVAVSVDVGYVCWTRAELQNAADSAALAGASQLLLPHVPGSPSATNAGQNVVNKATAQAQRFAGYHRAGGVTLTLPAEDVVVGSFAAGSAAVAPWAAGDPLPGSVQVTTRRSSAANGPVPLFFGQALGAKSWSGSATATATCNAGASTVTGFTASASGPLPPLLPLAIDATFWNTLVTTGKSPDGTVHDAFTATAPTSDVPAPSNVSAGADGIPEFTDTFPNSTSPGNFGLISLRNSKATDTPTYSNWILHGPSATDIQSFGASGVQATPAAPLTVDGGPGVHSALVSDFASIVGQARVVPLFSSYGGNGSNTQYTVVGFAGVAVVSATGRGSNIDIVLQPMIVISASATVSPGATTGSTFVYRSTPVSLSN
jgi:hypothetical protein